MALNPNLPPIPEPIADLAALTAVARALKQRVEALTGRLAAQEAAAATAADGGAGTAYVLPVASEIQLGGIRVDGTTTTVTASVLSAHVDMSVVPQPAIVAPVMDGIATIGVSARYARQDHAHPHDTSNPEHYQTAGDVALSIASSAYLLTTAKWGALNLNTLPALDPGGGKPWIYHGFLAVGAHPTMELEDGTGGWALEDGTGTWAFG